MSSPFTITPTPPTTLKLEVGQGGKFSFTVTDLAAPDSAREVILQALVVDDDKEREVDWLAVGSAQAMTMRGGKTETIAITVKPLSTTPRGEYTIRLVVADRIRPNDIFTHSAPVTCELLARPGPPPRKQLPKWLIPAIVGAVVVVGGGAFVIGKLAGSHRACDDGATTTCAVGSCPGTQTCAAGTWNLCVLDNPSCGQAPPAECKDDDKKACTIGSCPGTQGCTAGKWASCVLDNPSCGQAPPPECKSGEKIRCASGSCAGTQVCTDGKWDPCKLDEPSCGLDRCKEGAMMKCELNSCPGTHTCSKGKWGMCVTDPKCRQQ